MRSLSKNVRKDLQEKVLQGSKKNDIPKKMKMMYRRKLICEVCQKTSKKTFRKTFYMGQKKRYSKKNENKV